MQLCELEQGLDLRMAESESGKMDSRSDWRRLLYKPGSVQVMMNW